MTTVIMSTYNGDHASKETFINQLENMLKNQPLDRRFEEVDGDYFAKNNIHMVVHRWATTLDDGTRAYLVEDMPENVWNFSGNFLGYSFAYNVYTDEPGLIERLKTVTRENTESKAYREQACFSMGRIGVKSVGKITGDWAQRFENSPAYLVYR